MTEAGSSPSALAGGLDGEAAKRLARHADAAIRRALAARADLAPELLFFLAADPDSGVRGAVAGNAATPRQADDLLTADRAPDVRSRLAEKAAARLPRDVGDIPADPGPLDRLTVKVIERLASDPSEAVRRTLAEALAELAHAPARAVRRLAADPADPVACPILERSPQLSEDDLADLARDAPAPAARRTIAGRPGLGARVADAIAASGDSAAIAVLLANGGAQIREATLDRLLDAAPDHPEWHPPFVRRPDLSDDAVARLAGFVALALVEELGRRPGLGAEAAAEVAKAVADRTGDPYADAPSAEPETVAGTPSPVDPAEALDAAVMAGDRRAVVAALAAMTGLSAAAVERVLATRSPGAVVALVRRAGQSMRMAAKVQLRIAGIPARKAWVAGPDGDYPEDDATLARLLDVALGDAAG